MEADIDIINLAKCGDKNAYIALFEEVKNNLYTVALAILKNNTDVEDALQETCLSAYTSICKLTNPEYFKTWITRILINHCIKIKRKQNQFTALDYQHLEEVKNSLSYEGIDLWNAIDKLTEKDKKIILLRYFNDMKIEEIARVLQCSLSTVKSRLYRANDKLKVIMRGEHVGKQL